MVKMFRDGFPEDPKLRKALANEIRQYKRIAREMENQHPHPFWGPESPRRISQKARRKLNDMKLGVYLTIFDSDLVSPEEYCNVQNSRQRQ